MSPLLEQIAALEAQADGAKPRYVVVGLAPHTFQIAEWQHEYYSVRSNFGTHGTCTAAYAYLVSLGLAKETVR